MTGYEDDDRITHIVPQTVPTEALLDELLDRFHKEKRGFTIAYELKSQDGAETEDIRVGGQGNNSTRLYLATCILDWVKKRANIGYKEEGE